MKNEKEHINFESDEKLLGKRELELANIYKRAMSDAGNKAAVLEAIWENVAEGTSPSTLPDNEAELVDAVLNGVSQVLDIGYSRLLSELYLSRVKSKK